MFRQDQLGRLEEMLTGNHLRLSKLLTDQNKIYRRLEVQKRLTLSACCRFDDYIEMTVASQLSSNSLNRLDSKNDDLMKTDDLPSFCGFNQDGTLKFNDDINQYNHDIINEVSHLIKILFFIIERY